MKFNKYLEALLGSKVKVKMLRVLFRFNSKGFTSRELADQINVSHTAVLKSVNDLQGMNIVRIESIGTSNSITLNRDSHLYDILKNLFVEERDTLEELKGELSKIYPHAKKLALFGSIAKKEESFGSDIDLLIVANDKDDVKKRVAEKQEEFSKKFGNVISAMILTESEYQKKKNSPLINRIRKNHILLKGEEL